jgi:hypothetical protein
MDWAIFGHCHPCLCGECALQPGPENGDEMEKQGRLYLEEPSTRPAKLNVKIEASCRYVA